jgi:hypothetical protein
LGLDSAFVLFSILYCAGDADGGALSTVCGQALYSELHQTLIRVISINMVTWYAGSQL